jgi:hypothetical protein
MSAGEPLRSLIIRAQIAWHRGSPLALRALRLCERYSIAEPQAACPRALQASHPLKVWN